MTILVIGKGGQLARALAASSAGHLLTFAGRPDVDLAIPGLAASAIADLRPSLVINAAAYTQVDHAEDERDLAFRVNAEAAGEIARAAAAVGAGIIHLSTDYVFDGNSVEPWAEDAPTNPLNVYGESKLAGEEAVRSANQRHMVVRTSWLVGPHGHNFVRTMLRLAAERDEISVVDDQFGRPTVVSDLGDALLAIGARWETVEAGTYHLAGGGEPASWADLADAVMDERRHHLGDAPTIRRVESSVHPTAAVRPRSSILDLAKSRATLGIELPDWQPSVAALVSDLLRQPA